MGDRGVEYRVWVGIPDGKNHLKDLGLGGMIMLKWIFNKWNGGRHGLG